MNYNKTRCIICWQVLGSKKQLLHGMKCLKFGICETLKLLLNPLDFKTLCDESIFPEARICNLCFIAIKQIPKGVSKMQDLLKVPINLVLYTPHRRDCDTSIDSMKKMDRKLKSPYVAFQDHSLNVTKTVQKLTVQQKKPSHKSAKPSNRATKHKEASGSFNCRPKLHYSSKDQKGPLSLHKKTKRIETTKETTYKTENDSKKHVSPMHSTVDIFDGEKPYPEQPIKLRKLDHNSESTSSRLTTDVNLALPLLPAANGQIEGTTPASNKLTENTSFIESTLNINGNIRLHLEPNIDKERRIQKFRVNTHPLPKTRSCMRLRSTQKQIKHTNIACYKTMQSVQTVHYKQPIKFRKREFSNDDNIIEKTPSSGSATGSVSVMSKRSVEVTVARSDNSGTDPVLMAISYNGGKNKSKLDELVEVAASTVLKTDIPTKLGKHSKKKLQGLTEKVQKYLASKKPRSLMIRCPEKSCEHSYPLWRHLAVHIRYYHHDGAKQPKKKFAEPMSKLVETSAPDEGMPGSYKCTFEGCSSIFSRKEKYELHLGTHVPESVLYCEKCGKQFGCQRYLDEHYKVHEKNVKNAFQPPKKTVACEVSGCDKKFTCSVYMKRHIVSYHMGRRHQPVAGVFFTCSVDGCGKKFTLKSTLCRHNLLVHKGGDYKLKRTVVRYPCTDNGCGLVFNRKNLLEKHLVTVHDQIPKHLLSHQPREQDYKENMCTYCGMVLTDAQLLQHEKVYHCSNSNEEISPYSCRLEGCNTKFITQAERKAHVKNHVEKPPYKCEVEECKETFFLLKNLDNHLWNHCKKASTCDVDGCSQTFGDQIQLAKHSKVHYDGKMKCPWRNCGSWFTAMGTLKQHFLAHSRSLKANFGWDFVCNECDRVFSSIYGLKNHKKTHGDINSEHAHTTEFKCEEPGCRTEFSQHKHFFDHFLHHFTNSPTACKFEGCTEICPTMLLQSKHGKSHYGGKYMCPWQDCDKMFASSFFQVKKHVYKHLLSIPTIAADRPHSCSQCDMVFRIQTNLTNHMAQHSEKSDYVCTVCGKKFHHNHLKRHMLTHRQEKPHACPHCGVRYGTVNGLKFHILQKHGKGKWPYSCSYCSKGFISSTEMRRHLPSHTKEKPFSCELCGDMFATHTGYKGHMRKHTGQKYVCEVEGCGKVYTTPLSMRGHKAQHEGFSKMCQFCGKTFKNPYGHKCKASRDAKQKDPKKGPIDSGPNVMPSTSAAVPIPVPTSTVATIQHTVIIPRAVSNHEATVQQTDRIIMVPNAIQQSNLLPSSVTNSIIQGLPLVMPQALGHVLPNHSIIQDTTQPFPMDTSKKTTTNVPGDYTFSNYVVFWDSQNLS